MSSFKLCRYLIALCGFIAPQVFATDLTISAAASLTNAFQDIARAFEITHPDAKIALNFGASGALLQQLANGAPVDVFATADQETMDAAEQKGLIAPATRRSFAANSLVLVVPTDSPLNVKSLADLRQAHITRIAIGNPTSVPAGRYAKHALETAGVWSELQTKIVPAQNVRQALDYIARGEVDIGFVYFTDTLILNDQVRVAFDVPLDIPITYPLAAVANSKHAAEAEAFIAFAMLPAPQAILTRYGFRKP